MTIVDGLRAGHVGECRIDGLVDRKHGIEPQEVDHPLNVGGEIRQGEAAILLLQCQEPAHERPR